MRSFSSTGAIIHLIAGAMLLASTAAHADELIVMPYACAVAGGKPVLTPSSDQGYSIVGRREQRDFSACSPVNPDVCRKWTIYRFDLDCGGARVPWLSVAAAADARANGRTWIENGRLQLEMPAWWSDPCAPAADIDHRRRSPGFGDVCGERRGAPRRDFVDMPAGFAPMLGIDAIFVAAPKSHPASPLAAANQASTKAARAEPPKQPAEAPVEGQKTSATAQGTSKPESRTAATSAADGAANNGSAPIVPEIINRGAGSESGAKPADGLTGAIPQAIALSPEARAALVAGTPPAGTDAAPSPARQAQWTPESTTQSISTNLIDRIRAPLTPTALAIGGLMTLGLFAVAWMVRRERAQTGPMPSRDIASISLDARSRGQELVVSRAWLPARTRPNRLQQQPGAGVQANWGDAIPTTRDEALHVLGMGVTPDISETAVKKIVDGLRLSWHPDHAKDPADQQMRELRTKQINAAWEVLMGKRAEQ